jgi:hypothetical protein
MRGKIDRRALAMAFLVAIAAAADEPPGVVPVLPMPSAAAVNDDISAAQGPSPELMTSLMVWIEARLDLPMPGHTPTVIRKSKCGLFELVFQVPCRDAPHVQAAQTGDVIWLPYDWRADNLRDLSNLLHELVHFMQHHAGVPWTPCQAEAIERPAYAAQFDWLKAAGADPFEILGIGPLRHLLLTDCVGDW